MKNIILLFILGVGVWLVGCSPEVSDEVKNYVDEVKARKNPYKPDLPDFSKPQPLDYTSGSIRDPFIPFFLEQKQEAPTNAIVIQGGPDMNRKREPLEAYPLSSLIMVGTIQKEGVFYALIRDPGGRIHRVVVGNYLGQNAGEIQSITEEEIFLKEWISDNRGGWKELENSLYLLKAIPVPGGE